MLLAVDTSTQWVGLALFDGDQIVGEMIWQTHNHHTVELAPAVENLMLRSGVVPASLQALAVALGPGSFTSLRIGLALVKGFALALNIPVVGVPTLDILAASQPLQDLPMAAILQAGRSRLAVGWYAPVMGMWQPQGAARVYNLEELSKEIQKPTLVCGELTPTGRQVLARKKKNVILASPAQGLRRPSYLAELAWQRWQVGDVAEVISLAPIYLHVAEAIPA
jgi:tRNA threonylcarbamoyladenosine biosynthesis protein TsaB